MKYEIKLFIEIFFVLVFLNLANAQISINCSRAGIDAQECSKILADSSLSQAEKEDLYLNLLIDQNTIPNYNALWGYNKGLEFSEIPQGAQSESNGIIQNAWLKIIALESSYFDSNSSAWFAAPEGQLLTAYSYSIQQPTEKESGDCATYYSYALQEEDLRISLNGKEFATQKISEYSADVQKKQLNFSAKLKLRAELTAVHYKMKERCRQDGGNRYCTTNCEYSHTTKRQDIVNLKDDFEAEKPAQEPKVEVARANSNALKTIKFSAEGINSLDLSVGKSEFRYSNSIFELGTTEFGALYAKKISAKQKEMQGFTEFGYDVNSSANSIYANLGTTEKGDCALLAFSDFEEIELSENCNNKKLETPILLLSAEKSAYDANEAIKISASLSDESGAPIEGREITLNYGSGALLGTTGAQGTADFEIPPGSAIGAVLAYSEGDMQYSDAAAEKRFALVNSESWNTGFGVFGFVIVYYLMFLIAKRWVHAI